MSDGEPVTGVVVDGMSYPRDTPPCCPVDGARGRPSHPIYGLKPASVVRVTTYHLVGREAGRLQRNSSSGWRQGEGDGWERGGAAPAAIVGDEGRETS
jgi:hypothetical protein